MQELGRKGYWAHVTPSPDFTFMFLPGDAYLAAAEEHDAELFSFAYERGVLLRDAAHDRRDAPHDSRRAGRTRTPREHAEAVLKVASELHERLTTMAEHFAKLGRGLDSAVNAYNKAVGSYGSRVLVSARRLEGLAPTKSSLDALEPLTEHTSVADAAASAGGRRTERGRRLTVEHPRGAIRFYSEGYKRKQGSTGRT